MWLYDMIVIQVKCMHQAVVLYELYTEKLIEWPFPGSVPITFMQVSVLQGSILCELHDLFWWSRVHFHDQTPREDAHSSSCPVCSQSRGWLQLSLARGGTDTTEDTAQASWKGEGIILTKVTHQLLIHHSIYYQDSVYEYMYTVMLPYLCFLLWLPLI